MTDLTGQVLLQFCFETPVTNIPVVVITFHPCNHASVTFIQSENLLFAGVVQTRWQDQEFF